MQESKYTPFEAMAGDVMATKENNDCANVEHRFKRRKDNMTMAGDAIVPKVVDDIAKKENTLSEVMAGDVMATSENVGIVNVQHRFKYSMENTKQQKKQASVSCLTS